MIAIRPLQAASDVLAFKALLLLPAFCIVSTLWSDVPSASFRFGLQLAVTFVIAIVVSRRLPLRMFLSTILFVLVGIVGTSILAGNYRIDTGALTGFYASKNAMGMAAAFLALIAVGFIEPRSPSKALTLLGMTGFVVGMGGVLLAQSVSALAALTIGIGVFVAILVLRNLRAMTQMIAGIFLIVVTLLSVLLILANFDALADVVLRTTGKDMTLTGRTDLWSIAIDLIAERPILGVGYQAFWVPGNPTAEAIWFEFGIQSQSGFSFHNTYLSNAVEIGVLGVFIQTIMIGAALLMSARMALARTDRASVTLVAFVAMIVSMTPIDVHVFFQLSLASSFLIAVIVYTWRDRRFRIAETTARSG